jgi:uncharacterized Zn-finger protein
MHAQAVNDRDDTVRTLYMYFYWVGARLEFRQKTVSLTEETIERQIKILIQDQYLMCTTAEIENSHSKNKVKLKINSFPMPLALLHKNILHNSSLQNPLRKITTK